MIQLKPVTFTSINLLPVVGKHVLLALPTISSLVKESNS